MPAPPNLPIAAAADRHEYIDITVAELISTDANTTINIYQQAEAIEFEPKMKMNDTTAPGDGGASERPVQWEKGSGTITGYTQRTGNIFAAAWAISKTWVLKVVDAQTTGDIWLLVIQMPSLKNSYGKDSSKVGLAFNIMAVPWYGPAGAEPAALPIN